jgi:anti-sigma factor RsiW
MSTLNAEDRANLTAYLDGELDAKTAQALEAKISLDPEARKEIEALKQTWGMLDHLPKATPTERFTERTLRRLSADRLKNIAKSKTRLHVVGRALAWTCAIVVAAGVGLGAGKLFAPKPPDAIGTDEPLIRHLRVVENWHHYENIEDLNFLRGLDQADLFGDPQGS